MKQGRKIIFGIWLLILVLASCWWPADVPVLRVQDTLTVYTETGDGYVLGYSSVYSSARADSDACYVADSRGRVGQQYSSGYSVWRSYLSFDTSGIPDDATITSATLYVCAMVDVSATDFDIKVYRYEWVEALCSNTEANWDGAYGGSATLEGTLRNTSAGWSTGTYYSMTVAAAGINKAGDT
ncbi:MAG: hypothetical protein H5T63_08705, partial [Chloroflexi bacterium]|nr:hypothetical protein [Chloroflexota bacterium]